MAFIVETISGDRKIQLATEEFIRPMSIGTQWGKIRIGVRVALNGAYTIPTCGFTMGICQGYQGYMSPNTVDYLGVQIGCSSTPFSQPYTFTAGTPPYYTCNTSSISIKKVAGNLTIANIGSTAGLIVGSPTTNRCQVFLDITKASPYIVNMWASTTAGNVQTDISSATFLANMENESAPSTVASVTGANNTTYTGNSLFDSVSILWNRSSPTIEISDIAVVRYL